MRVTNNSVKKYFLNFFVLEERREKRKPGLFAIQAIPNISKKIKKYNGNNRKERLPATQRTFYYFPNNFWT